MEKVSNKTFIEKTNYLINKYSPIIVLLTLFGSVAVGGSYLLSIKTHIEHNNILINKYYDEIKSQSNMLLTFKDSFYIKNEELSKQITKTTTSIGGMNTNINEIKERMIILEARLYDLKDK